MARALRENIRPITWAIFEEIKAGDWGIDGLYLRVLLENEEHSILRLHKGYKS